MNRKALSGNKFCRAADLTNEASVESFFVQRLLETLGYADSQILPKQSLEKLLIGGLRGHPQQKYKPDYAVRVDRKIRFIVEAKSPNEALDPHEWQPRAYCVVLNGAKGGGKPVKYHLLTNGLETRLYDPNLNDSLLRLKLAECVDGNSKFEQLRAFLSRETILTDATETGPTLRLEKHSLAEVNAAFSWCHQHIYRKDDISQSDAFSEFVKLISLKLMSDRKIRDAHPEIVQNDSIDVPITEVDFSLHWIDVNERNTHNPINNLLFRRFMDNMEGEIARDKRKRIFDIDDQINLKPETIRGVVRRLEGTFLFGIDADLNGRLFETFLNATMRGKDLGQFFTPRSLVKLGVELCQLKVHPRSGAKPSQQADRVIDACCGSGGFLIDALADMWTKADRQNISQTEKVALKQDIKNNNIVGIDVANAPILARIARLNMYLHGDGGTAIYHLNALDKDVADAPTDSAEIIKEKAEWRKVARAGDFDVVLTNPPFAKAMDRTTEEEQRMLDSYEIGRDGAAVRASLRSCLLFAERYHQLLRAGGVYVTIIDDGILSGDDYKWFREQLRKWFLIRAVVSLPGDAFQRSNARVKTSYLVAEKRDPETDQQQPPVFMYPCQHVGIDDPKRQRARAGDGEARILAEQEIKTVMAEYAKFLTGDSSKYVVPAARVGDRLDVKNCLMERNRSVKTWRKSGFRVVPLHEAVAEREWDDDEVIRKDYSEAVRVLVVRYDGTAEEAEEVVPSEGTYAKLYPVRTGDIVISNIAASYGSIAVVPLELDGLVVSNEYTVLTPLPGFDATVLQMVLRSPEVRSDILLSSSGANRTRTRWRLMRDILIPYPDKELENKLRRLVDEAEVSRRNAAAVLGTVRNLAETSLLLRSETATTILAAFKPPK